MSAVAGFWRGVKLAVVGLTVLTAGWFLPAAGATAQQTTALSGTVADASGAVIPGATVAARVVGDGDGGAVKAKADAAGTFRFAALTPGQYLLIASATGFATSGQTVTVGTQGVSVTLTLQVGQTSQTVAVSATAATLATTDTSTGGMLDTKAMQAVPLNGRSFTDALAVEPGVAPASSAQPNGIVMSGVASRRHPENWMRGRFRLEGKGRRQTVFG